MPFLTWLRARMREPSTWGGVATAVATAAVVPPPIGYIVFAMSLAAVFMQESKHGG